ncbi:MAG: hypothetical protein ACTFAK_15365 [Candidatus Electronema sp. VV]
MIAGFLLRCYVVYQLNGGSNADDISRYIKQNEKVRKFAQFSLERWYDNLIRYVNENGFILIMGNNAKELLETSKINSDGKIVISKERAEEKEKSLFEVLSDKFNLLFVVHASALAPIYNWLTKQKFQVNSKLKDAFQKKTNRY